MVEAASGSAGDKRLRLPGPATWDFAPEALSVQDVARLLGVDRKTVYAAVELGQIPARRLGARTIRISKTVLRDWLGASEVLLTRT